MKHLRKLALLLAILMLTGTACDKNGNSDDKTPINTDTSTVDENAGDKLDLPDYIEGEYDVISILAAENYVGRVGDLNDEISVLEKAKHEAYDLVEDRFDITLEFTNITPWGDTATLARQSINAGSDDYQMVFTMATHMVNLVNEGLFLPLSELPYVNIEKPWWNKQYIESVSFHEDEQYILFGDITYNTLQRTTCVFFNIPLLEKKLNMKPQDLYDLVYAGEWTIDKMNEIVSQVYEDVNGSTTSDYDDIHGLVINGASAFNWMAFSSGLKFTSRSEEGYPVINLNTPTTVDLVDKLLALMINNDAVYNEKDNQQHVWKFSNGNALFLVNRFFLTGWEHLRVMEDDFGILPMPKYSEDIDGYHSTNEQLVQWGGVPVTAVDPVFTSAVAEAMAYEGRVRVTPAYYETTLKLKQTRDDASMAMIDLIMEGRDTDYLFINPLGSINNIFSNIFNAGQNNFASQYASLVIGATRALNDLIEDYESLN